MASVYDRVVQVTARVLKVDASEIQSQHNFSSDLSAESIQSIELVAMFEEEFGIEMEEDAALSVDTVGTAAEYIEGVCKAQGVEI